MTVVDPQTVTVPLGGDVKTTLGAIGLADTRPVVILLGGADGLDPALEQALWPVFAGCLSPLAQDMSAAIVDGGTDSGVMRMIGRARTEAGHDYPLVGVSAAGTIGARDAAGHTAPSDPHHSHLVIVPGERWGDEGPWLRAVARVIARDRGIVAVLVNGGSVAQDEAVDCAASGIPVVVLTGSGRAADALASESTDSSEPGAATISAVELGDLDTLRAVLTARLAASPDLSPAAP
jgi:hypothetical protein